MTILIIDLALSNQLCDSLKGILKHLSLEIQQVTPDPAGPGFAPSLSKTVARPERLIVFLVLDPTSFERAAGVIKQLKAARADAPIIAVVETAEPNLILDLLKAGATDFITPPLRPIDILPRAWRLLRQNQTAATPVYALKERLGLKQIIGQSPRLMAEVKKFPLVAKCDASILILGETGTGKELCARAIHYLSPRAGKPFIPVNCGAIPLELVENELFGHEREAFTGARTSRAGLIQEADGGTLFLDEIDCLPPGGQVKLLRFLQEKEYRPLGSTKMQQADVRVMAATNVDMEEAVRSRKIRQDLYYRLNVVPLALPPLRERRGDIPLLARHFLNKYAGMFGKAANHFSAPALEMLMSYDWPGNVRELEHIIERALVLTEGEVIESGSIELPEAARPRGGSFQQMKARVIARFEKEYLNGLLLAHGGNITRAAEAAGKDRRALRQLIRKHRIEVSHFRGGG
jgi:two-component system response regulator GlrR